MIYYREYLPILFSMTIIKYIKARRVPTGTLLAFKRYAGVI